MYIALVGYGFYVQNQNEEGMKDFGEIPTLVFDLVIAYFIVFRFIGVMWSENDEEKEKNDIKTPQSKPIKQELSKEDLHTKFYDYPEPEFIQIGDERVELYTYLSRISGIKSDEIDEESEPEYKHNPDLVIELVNKRPSQIRESIYSDLTFNNLDFGELNVELNRALAYREKVLIKSAKIELLRGELVCHFYAVENSEDRLYYISPDNIPPLKEGDILDIDSILLLILTGNNNELIKRIEGRPVGYNIFTS